MAAIQDNNMMQAETIGELFQTMDKNEDGLISFQEFKEASAAKPWLVAMICDPMRGNMEAPTTPKAQ
eukprot:gene30749-38513_t